MKDMKILIADASSVYKKIFEQAVSEAGVSAEFVMNGDEALEKINTRKFEAIIIDAEIPGTGALELVSQIKKISLKASVLIMARVSASNKRLCAEAAANGAECTTKPIYASYGENINWAKLELSKFYKKRIDGYPENKEIERKITGSAGIKKDFRAEIVLIAASTGGPRALETIITNLSADFPVPVLVVQHMPRPFIKNLTLTLDHKSNLNIKVAEKDEVAEAGTVYMAPGGTHMTLGSGRKIYFDNSPPINGVKPAADMLFESVAESFAGARVLAVILTGMGRDGEAGLFKLKEKCECLCLAQSERTCVVYGMPRAAVENGFADKILDLDEIALEIAINTGKS